MEITKEYIKEGQYKESKYLESRIRLHNRFSNYSFHSWVFGNLPALTKPMKILHIGCGTGQFWIENYKKMPKGSEIILTDISKQMLDRAKSNLNHNNINFEVADAENLPFEDGYFDWVMAHHIIYHTDYRLSLPQIKRVAKKGGIASITTNSQDHMADLFDLGKKLDPNFPKDRHIDSFVMEKADKILPEFFTKITKKLSEDNMYVDDADFIVDFIRSEIEARKPNLNKGFYGAYRDAIRKAIKEKGFYIVRKISPLYVCYNE